MKFMITVSFNTQAGNVFVKNPSFGEKLQTIFTEQKAESVYFGSRNGDRTIHYVTEMTDGAKMPHVAEPWWLSGATSVDCIPVFTPADMEKAAPEVIAMTKKWG